MTFEEYMKDRKAKIYKPSVTYFEDGDFLEASFKDGLSYDEKVTDKFYLLRDTDTDEVLGFQIWDFSNIKENASKEKRIGAISLKGELNE